jgi:hypothetical protein
LVFGAEAGALIGAGAGGAREEAEADSLDCADGGPSDLSIIFLF